MEEAVVMKWGKSAVEAFAGLRLSSAQAGLAAAALPLVVFAFLGFGLAVYWEVQPALVSHQSPLFLN